MGGPEAPYKMKKNKKKLGTFPLKCKVADGTKKRSDPGEGLKSSLCLKQKKGHTLEGESKVAVGGPKLWGTCGERGHTKSANTVYS